MKDINHKKEIEKEVYIFIKNNYKKIESLDIYETNSSYIYYKMYNIKVSIYYRKDDNDNIEYIQLSVGNEEIGKYNSSFNKNYRLYRNILNYFLKSKEDNKYAHIYEQLIHNKPVNVKRKEKYKKLKNQ